MELIADTSLRVAPLVTMQRPGEYRLTVVVKGTFDLRPGATAQLAAEPWFPTGDEPYPDDDEGDGSPRYPSDFAQYKPRADLLLVGTCYPPGGTPVAACTVRFQVGAWGKALRVSGDREWTKAAGVRLTPTVARPFASMPLRYERSHGGAGYDRNPVGIGYGDIVTDSGRRQRPVPNIEVLSSGGGQPAGGPEPAGFGPLAMTWADRFAKAKAGTYGKKWLQTQWPGFPEDFDWGFFNAAPADQQLAGYLTGDEELQFENLHPDVPVYRCRLPGLRARCFRHVAGNEPSWGEIPLALDTLWVDMDDERLVLVWRGSTPVGRLECEEIDHLYVGSEPVEDPPHEAGFHRAAFEARLAAPDAEAVEPEESGLDVEVEAELAAAQASFREACAVAGFDPDCPPEPDAETQRLVEEILERYDIQLPGADPEATREEVQARHRRGEGLREVDLRGLDLSLLALVGADFSGSVLAGTSFRAGTLREADLSGAELIDADLSGADLCGARLGGADLTGASLEGATLTGACFDGALLDGARCKGAVMDGVSAVGATFVGADLSGASLRGSNLRDADLSETTLDGAELAGADLSAASLVGATGDAVNLSGAELTGLRATGTRLPRAQLKQARARDSIWDGAELTGSDLSHGLVDGSDFSGAILEGAILDAVSAQGTRFYRTRLAGASVREANFFQSTLQGADLTRTDLRGASLYGTELLEAATEEARFDGANLQMTKLEP